MSRLVLVLGDQLNRDVAALRTADKSRDIVVMAEVAEETEYVPHHPKKIALVLSAMRHFAASLVEEGWRVQYYRLDDQEPVSSICGALVRAAAETSVDRVVATEPGEWRLRAALDELPLILEILEDDRFIATHKDFEAWADGRKELRMEWFYRDMRRKTGLLMEGDKPVGDQWNFDQENRKKPPKSVDARPPLWFETDRITDEVLALVEQRFQGNFGRVKPFWFAVTRPQALDALAHFVEFNLPSFGDYQDAMLRDEPFLWHSVLSIYMNIGLLGPLEVARAAEQAWVSGFAPLNAVEGFIRQIIGWREYVRGIYFREGATYPLRNALKHTRNLPNAYWGGETKMECIRQVVAQTRDEAYAHHIQRLMVTGNFALLAGIDPAQVHAWYLSVYADAFEWVESPNTIGMSQFADGGIVGSKPYVSSGNYIDRMSNYCGACAYSVKQKTGETACPFNTLYWHFLDRHRTRFEKNPRMVNMYRTWDRMDLDRRETIIEDGQGLLNRLDTGKVI